MKRIVDRCLARLVTVLVLAVAAPAQVQTQTQDFPSKPVRIIVPYAPGGGTDAVARFIGEKLAERLGQAVVIDNRAGAGGVVGTEQAARSPADGYTLVLGSTATHAVNPSLYRKISYDAIADFDAIGLIATTPALLVVNSTLPVDSVSKLLDYIRSRPGDKAPSFASAGAGSIQHMAGELFKSMTGTDILHIPYKGAGPAMTDLLAGHVSMAFDTMPSAMPQVRAGRVKALGISSSKRHAALPDVPTIGETVPGYELLTWYGLFAPRSTPPAVVQRLNAELRQVLGDAGVQDKFRQAGLDIQWSTPQALAERLKADVPRMRKLIEQAGARVD